jgi:hypothetical protein
MKTNCVIGIGYNCLTAVTLKNLQLRTGAFPFDWTFSSVDIITDCLRTNFTTYLDKSFYYEGLNSNQQLIAFHKEYGHSFFNHKNPLQNEDDYFYTQRTVCRFNTYVKDESMHVTFLVTINSCDSVMIINDKFSELLVELKKYCKCKFNLQIINLSDKICDNEYTNDLMCIRNIQCKDVITDGINFKNKDDQSKFETYIKDKYTLVYREIHLNYKFAIVYTNCHGHSYQRQLIHNNIIAYHVFLGESLFANTINYIDLFKKCDIFIYIPIHNTSKTLINLLENNNISQHRFESFLTDNILKILKPTCKIISVCNPYCDFLFIGDESNHIINDLPNHHVTINMNLYNYSKINVNTALDTFLYNNLSVEEVIDKYEKSMQLLHNREIDCDIKCYSFILDNIQNDRLFLTHSHPSHILMNYLCNCLCSILQLKKIYIDIDTLIFPPYTIPIAPYVKTILNLKYKSDIDPIQFYKHQLKDFISYNS